MVKGLNKLRVGFLVLAGIVTAGVMGLISAGIVGYGGATDVPEANRYEDLTETERNALFPTYPAPGSVSILKTASWADEDEEGKWAKVAFDINSVASNVGADVIVVRDRSGSMQWNGATNGNCTTWNSTCYPNAVDRHTATASAIRSLVDILAEPRTYTDANGDEHTVDRNNSMAYVEFSANATLYQQGGGTRNYANTFVTLNGTAGAAYKDVVEPINASGVSGKTLSNTADAGTNYQAAANAAITALGLARDSEERDSRRPIFVVFLSDGEPSNNQDTTVAQRCLLAGFEACGVGDSIVTAVYPIGVAVSGSTTALTNLEFNAATQGVTDAQVAAGALDAIFEEIARAALIAASNVVLKDAVNTDYFDVSGSTVSDTHPITVNGVPYTSWEAAGLNVEDGKVSFAADKLPEKVSFSFYVKLTADHCGEDEDKEATKCLDWGDMLKTNSGAEVFYENSDGVYVQRDVDVNKLVYPGGTISYLTYRADKDGVARTLGGVMAPNDLLNTLRGSEYALSEWYFEEDGSPLLQAGETYYPSAEVCGAGYKLVSVKVWNNSSDAAENGYMVGADLTDGLTVSGVQSEFYVVVGCTPEFKLTVEHVYDDKAGTSTEEFKNHGDSYTTSPDDDERYSVSIPGNANGTVPFDDVTVTYNYTRVKSKISYDCEDWSVTCPDDEYVPVDDETEVKDPPEVTGYTCEWVTDDVVIGQDGRFTVPGEDVLFTLDCSKNKYNLTIYYVYDDGGGTAAPTYTESVEYEDSYSVTSPEINWYTADTLVVSGTMGDGNVEVTVKYIRNKSNISYDCEDWSTECPDGGDENVGDDVEIADPPEVTGYTCEWVLGNIVVGQDGRFTVPEEDVVFTLDCSKNNYTLTIYYVYEDGSTAAPTYTRSVEYGNRYFRGSPRIRWYTADALYVRGVMGDGNVEITVRYIRNKSNISYDCENWLVECPAGGDENVGDDVEIADPPQVTGYTCEWVLGNIVVGQDGQFTVPEEDVVFVLDCQKNKYNLTIEYVFEDDSEAAPTYMGEVEYEDGYLVDSPVIVGYKTDIEVVSGTMGAEDVSVRVVYVIDETQTKVLAFTIEYYQNGVLVERGGRTRTVWINYPGDVVPGGGVSIDMNTYAGMVFDRSNPWPIPQQIRNGSVIRIYYVNAPTALITPPDTTPLIRVNRPYYPPVVDTVPVVEDEPEVLGDSTTRDRRRYKPAVKGDSDKKEGAAWALLNLILTILTALGMIALVITYFSGKKKKENKKEGYVTKVKKHGAVRVVSVIPAVAAIVVFIWTEDMTLPMRWTDRWTIIMLAIAVIQLLVMFLARKSKKTVKIEERKIEVEEAKA